MEIFVNDKLKVFMKSAMARKRSIKEVPMSDTCKVFNKIKGGILKNLYEQNSQIISKLKKKKRKTNLLDILQILWTGEGDKNIFADVFHEK